VVNVDIESLLFVLVDFRDGWIWSRNNVQDLYVAGKYGRNKVLARVNLYGKIMAKRYLRSSNACNFDDVTPRWSSISTPLPESLIARITKTAATRR